jgi:hypothetical protein
MNLIPVQYKKLVKGTLIILVALGIGLYSLRYLVEIKINDVTAPGEYSVEQNVLKTFASLSIQGTYDQRTPRDVLVTEKEFQRISFTACKDALSASPNFQDVDITDRPLPSLLSSHPLNLHISFALSHVRIPIRADAPRYEIVFRFTRSRLAWSSRLDVDEIDFPADAADSIKNTFTGREHPGTVEGFPLDNDIKLQADNIYKAVFQRCEKLSSELDPNINTAQKLERYVLEHVSKDPRKKNAISGGISGDTILN